jgi:hypothetical protein
LYARFGILEPTYISSSSSGRHLSDALVHLLEAYVVHVAELGSSGRQLREVQEIDVERVGAGWGVINGGAAFKNAGGILRIKQADHGASVVQHGT